MRDAQSKEMFCVTDEDAGRRLDQVLAARLSDISRVRVRQLIEQGRVSIVGRDGTARPPKVSGKLKAGDTVTVCGEVAVPRLRAQAEEIPLNIVYEDELLAVIDKPAGMMVHAGSGATDSARNRGTLVNALLHHLASLSSAGGELRPGIVHRLDKQTSGLIVVAKDDRTHRRLAEMFARRQVHKTYVALVHGAVKLERGTLSAAIGRDRQRRTRMTTRVREGRTAISHYTVRERFESRYGSFTLLEVGIETGRTHQIRVHLSSIGHPVVGDTLYGAPRQIVPREARTYLINHIFHPEPFDCAQGKLREGSRVYRQTAGSSTSVAAATSARNDKAIYETASRQSRKAQAPGEAFTLERNFLHAARLEFQHPESGEELRLESPLPKELLECMGRLKGQAGFDGTMPVITG